MQILRPFVAHCYRGGRSICNREFFSLTSFLLPKRRREMEKMFQDFETAKEIAHKEGSVV
ncbi:hypothetical protein AALP_AA2G000800 [Arabis alpina]|uniref:Uncharacterized protein n=1 Tax=Arabis alpina TaxID=50452 RepID=A0A087HEC5_ARAAL|nr:hypothetical protein AALP_AA2G000800 [Arabis alpina]